MIPVEGAEDGDGERGEIAAAASAEEREGSRVGGEGELWRSGSSTSPVGAT